MNQGISKDNKAKETDESFNIVIIIMVGILLSIFSVIIIRSNM